MWNCSSSSSSKTWYLILKRYHPLNTSANYLFRQENLPKSWSPFSSLYKNQNQPPPTFPLPQPLTVKSIRATEQIFSPIRIFSPQVCLFCPLLTTHVPLVQLINNVFYCYRQTVLLNTIAGKAWRECKVQVFGVLWSSKPDAEEMEHLFPFFSVLENTALCRLQKQPDINSTAAAVFPWQGNRDVPSTAFASSPLSAQTHVLGFFFNFFFPWPTESIQRWVCNIISFQIFLFMFNRALAWKKVSFYSPDSSKDKKRNVQFFIHFYRFYKCVLDVEMHLQCRAQDSWLTTTASSGDGKPSADVKEGGNLPLLKCSSNPARNGPQNDNPK